MLEFSPRIFVFLTHYLRILGSLCKVGQHTSRSCKIFILCYLKIEPLCPLRCLPCKQRPFDLKGKVGQKRKVGPFARRVFALRIETQTCCKDLILEVICTVTYCVSCLIYFLPVSSPDETPRRELKIRRAAVYF